jgi:hypothetical protein
MRALGAKSSSESSNGSAPLGSLAQVDVRSEAELDILEAASWYDGERVGFGSECLAELRATFTRI